MPFYKSTVLRANTPELRRSALLALAQLLVERRLARPGHARGGLEKAVLLEDGGAL